MDLSNDEAVSKLLELLPALQSKVESGALDSVINTIDARKHFLKWKSLPERIILLRHGESQGNVDHTLYSSKGDSQLELTTKGFEQAREAGSRLAKLIAPDDRVFVAVSPFERTIQTLYGLYAGGFPRTNVCKVHHDPRIREQEFGNFQSIGLTAAVRAEEKAVGRFYYRRPNAESSADVYDRVLAFWDSLLTMQGPTSILSGRDKYTTGLLVTHGLTIRLLLMAIYHWSVETFETVYNLGNCHYIVLRKNMETFGYELCTKESFPPRLPWATRKVWIRYFGEEENPLTKKKLENSKKLRSNLRKGDTCFEELDSIVDKLELEHHFQCAKKYTVINYLAIKPPRTMNRAELFSQLVEGHDCRGSPEELEQRCVKIDVNNISLIDWKGEKGTWKNKILHYEMDDRGKASARLDVDTVAGGGFLRASSTLFSVKDEEEFQESLSFDCLTTDSTSIRRRSSSKQAPNPANSKR
eukprot:TRINITY_DN1349_c5_g1_i1.p1 TRINITY_DN1349_c5_g1~~TRINITY_DN1349_c5_g1_i1.p1  ORF type:complete len:470 (+),score=67.05 TRINITY_DN1349_c5_g1_i1:40-1449(+)